MTDENQNTSGEPTEPTPQFGSGEKQTEREPQNMNVEANFGSEDVTKLYKMNRDAQDFIDRLKEETSTMRNEIRTLQEELAKSRTIDDLLDSYGSRQQDDDSNSTGPKTPQLDEQELLAKLKDEVFKDMSQAERAKREQENWDKSVSLLKDRYGDGYAKYVDDRAKELDMSVNDMEAMARTQPTAFMELVGGSQKTRNPEPTRSSQKSFYSDPSQDLEVRYARVARLRRNLNTEEGREAARQWADPEFQAQYRMHILEKARRDGSQFNNIIR